MKNNKKLTFIGFLGVAIVAIVLLLVVAKFISSQQRNKNQEGGIPSIVSESHVLEAVENIEKLIAAMDEWKESNPQKPTYSIHFTGTDVIFKGMHNGKYTEKVFAKRAENAPDIGCTLPAKKPTPSCETALFSYDATCFPDIDICNVTVSEKDKDRFYLVAGTDPITHKWNRMCTSNETIAGNEICTYLSTKGWIFPSPVAWKQADEMLKKEFEKILE